MAQVRQWLTSAAKVVAAAWCIPVAIATSVAAAEPAPELGPWISEARLGALYHEDSRLKRARKVGSEIGRPNSHEGGVVDINAEVLLARPAWRFGNPLLDYALRPRLSIGGTLNTGGGTSHAWTGFAWDFHLTGKVFFETGLGVAIHNGSTGAEPAVGRLDGKRMLGCSPLLRQTASLGVNVTDHWRVMLTVEHLDNFDLCQANAGLTNMGARLGYKF
jgi:lipid A 3-O-deacylase